jgi:hypothetical protein
MNTGCRNDVHPVFIYILGYQISLETPLNYTKYSFCIIICKQGLDPPLQTTRSPTLNYYIYSYNNSLYNCCL